MSDFDHGSPLSPGVPAATAATDPSRHRRAVASRVALGAVIACGLAAGSYGVAAAASSHGGTAGTTGQALSATPGGSKSSSPTAPSTPPVPRLGSRPPDLVASVHGAASVHGVGGTATASRKAAR